MALSAWYDEMKRGFTPQANKPDGVSAPPGAPVLLQATGVELFALKPNRMLENSVSPNSKGIVEAVHPDKPAAEAPSEHMAFGEWQRAGEGQLILTGERLIWQSPSGNWEWRWERVSSIMLWLYNTLTIQYGAVPYRFELGQENGLKWLTYAGTIARQIADRTGTRIRISPF